MIVLRSRARRRWTALPNKTGERCGAPPLNSGYRASSVSIETPLEVWIVTFLVFGHGEIDVIAVISAFVMRATWESVVLRPSVLPDETAEVAKPLATAERPERLFTE